jgi:anti-sigma B factor antagonist
MESYLRVVVREGGDAIIVTVSGELDLASSPQLGEALARLRPAPGARLILDLRELGFIDVTGLRMLLGARDQARDRGTELALVNVPRVVRRLLSLSGATELLQAVDGG